MSRQRLDPDREARFWDGVAQATRFFMGEADVQRALEQLVRLLDDAYIPYAVVGAMALNEYGYRRVTVDIDILLTPRGLESLRALALGRGYAEQFPGSRGLRDVDHGVPIDVLVANTRPIVPGAIINVRPIGVLKMEDDAGGDEKIIAVPVPRLTKRYAHITDYSQLPEITVQQIQHSFEHYKDLEPGKWVKVIGWGDAAEARRLIAEAIERAKG